MINTLKKKELEHLYPSNQSMENASRIKDLISKNIIEAPPINLNEGGVFRQYVSKDLDSLRNIKMRNKKKFWLCKKNIVESLTYQT